MNSPERLCPKCHSDDSRAGPKLGDWTCDNCGHSWKSEEGTETQPSGSGKVRLFLSYGRRDAKELADRLAVDLAGQGYEIWQDTCEITTGISWQHEIVDGLRSAQVVIALMTPHSVRTTGSPDNADNVDSVCLGEISYALFNPPPRPVVPVMARTCEPPLAIFHLDYVDMRAWTESPDQYQAGVKRLLDGIQAALRGEKRYRSWHYQLDPFDFAAFLHAKRRDFVGRQWLFDRIDAWRVAHRREPALLITGDPGTGKSAIVAELVHRNPDGQVLAYHCCQWDVADTLKASRFVRSIAAMIAGKLEGYAALMQDPSVQEALSLGRCESDPGSALEQGILSKLEHLYAPEDGPRCLLIDALDESLLVAPGSPTIVDLLASRLDRLPAWLKVVATTRKESAVLERLAGLRAETLDAQSPENREDVRRFLDQRLSRPNLAERLVQSRLTASQVADALSAKSEGNFLYVEQALRGIENGVYQLTQLDALPPGMGGLYTLRFQRQFPDEASFRRAKQLLDVIVAAREPLDEQQLTAATELDSEKELPVVLERLFAYVPARLGGDNQSRYSIYHKSLGDWLTDRTRRGKLHSASLKRGHDRLAAMCWAEYGRGPHSMTGYALRHLPAHLVAAGRWDDLQSLLTDLAFLEAKTKAGLVFELAGDFTTAVRALPENRPQRRILRLLDEALRRNIHFIARHARDYPQALFQCLWNSSWWYDCPDAAEHYEAPKAGWSPGEPPWEQPGATLCGLLESWRKAKERASPGFAWVRSLRPPCTHLGTAQMAVLTGHGSAVQTVAFSPDGKRVVSGSRDKTARVWDAQSGAEVLRIIGHRDWVTSVSFSADGTQIVSGSRDGTVRRWDSRTGTELQCLAGRQPTISSVSFSPDGRLIASGSHDKTLRLWDVRSGAESQCLSGHQRLVSSVAFSPDGHLVVSGSDDQTVRVWDAQNGTQVACFEGHHRPVASVAFSVDGALVVSGSRDRSVRIWDLRAGIQLRCLQGHDGAVTGAVFSPDGGRIASASWDKTVRVWDATSGAQVGVLQGHEGLVMSVAFSPDNRMLASASYDKTVRIWNSEGGACLRCLRGHCNWIRRVAFSADGRHVISRSSDANMRVWDAETGKCVSLAANESHLAARSGGASVSPYRAVVRGLETVIEDLHGEQPIAWFALALDHVKLHPSKPSWTGTTANHLVLITLEGTVSCR